MKQLTNQKPFKKVITSDVISGLGTECVLIPTETAGPFPLDLTDKSESVDQALCYGWIDGIRKKVDERLPIGF